MKKQLFYCLIILSGLSACEEVPPYIDFTVPAVPLTDSTYINSNVPAAQHKAVLLEDITGVRCQNCPSAALKANDIVTQKTEDSVVVVALYPDIAAISNFTTPYSGVPRLTTEYSKQITETIKIPGGLPNGYVDRTIFAGRLDPVISPLDWINFVNERLKLKTPVNISITKSIKDTTLKVKIKLEYNASVNSGVTHKYSIFLIENGIVSSQLKPNGTDPNYVHNHALRYAFGNATGNALTESLVAGRTFIKEFVYETPKSINLANCHIVCLVSDASTNEVINVRQIH